MRPLPVRNWLRVVWLEVVQEVSLASCLVCIRPVTAHFPTAERLFCKGGRANAIPGAIMFSVFGAGGQGILNMLDGHRSSRSVRNVDDASRNPTDTGSRWNLVKMLSDEEYLAILQEKQLRLDAEVAVIDDEIQKLRSTK